LRSKKANFLSLLALASSLLAGQVGRAQQPLVLASPTSSATLQANDDGTGSYASPTGSASFEGSELGVRFGSHGISMSEIPTNGTTRLFTITVLAEGQMPVTGILEVDGNGNATAIDGALKAALGSFSTSADGVLLEQARTEIPLFAQIADPSN
jgi:hypothetical protein